RLLDDTAAISAANGVASRDRYVRRQWLRQRSALLDGQGPYARASVITSWHVIPTEARKQSNADADCAVPAMEVLDEETNSSFARTSDFGWRVVGGAERSGRLRRGRSRRTP